MRFSHLVQVRISIKFNQPNYSMEFIFNQTLITKSALD